jgi:hypothetical protein
VLDHGTFVDLCDPCAQRVQRQREATERHRAIERDRNAVRSSKNKMRVEDFKRKWPGVEL